MKKAKLAIFASGNGTNAAKIIEYFEGNQLVQISLLCVNKKDAPVIGLAKEKHLPVFVFTKEQLYETEEVLDQLILDGITHIVLAGFLWLVPANIIKKYTNRMINIHPALLPKYGGKGMYGMHVHRAIKEAKEPETGITIHLVTENYDEGEYFAQHKVLLEGSETAEEIGLKVQKLEHLYFPKEIEKWVNGNS